MLASIITPCYNPKNELLQTIRSVQQQSLQDYEHLIIDDHSSSPLSEELMAVINTDPKIRFIQRRWNAGPAVTRNRGISEAKGRFIAFLDADDEWFAQKLEEQINFMQKSQVALCYSEYEVIDSQGRTLGVRHSPAQLTYTDILKSNQIGCLTAIYDTEALGKVYMPNIAKRQDMGLWLRILKTGVIAKKVPSGPLAKYRVGKGSLSSNKLGVLKYQWRIYREVEKMSFFTSIGYFIHYLYRGVVRKV